MNPFVRFYLVWLYLHRNLWAVPKGIRAERNKATTHVSQFKINGTKVVELKKQIKRVETMKHERLWPLDNHIYRLIRIAYKSIRAWIGRRLAVNLL